MNKNGFSLTELITIISVISVLVLISFRYYGHQKKKTYRNIAQREMTDLMTLVKMAKQKDGYYHQFIYQMGYRPKGSLIANIGVKTTNSAPCCNNYPALGTAGCSKSKGSSSSFSINKGQTCPYGTKNKSSTNSKFQGPTCTTTNCNCESAGTYESYSHYTCDNSSLGKATDIHTICNDGSYSYDCSFKKTTSAISTSTSFGSCSTSCNCNSISLGAISGSFSEEMVLSHDGSLCVD